MSKYYFTFGTDPRYPYQGGWVEVEAENARIAIAVFNAVHPPREGSKLMNCCSYYPENVFNESGMADGNLGAKCHAKITVQIERMTKC